MQSQINLNCQIYFLIQWLQVFYRITYRKITRKYAADTKLSDFVTEHKLHEEFDLLKKGWNFVKNELENDRMQLDGVECVQINLNNIEDQNCKIDVFCISEDK